MQYALVHGCALEHVADETVITSPKGDVVVISETGGAILNALLDGERKREVASDLAGHYGIDERLAFSDVESLVRRLFRCGVLESSEERLAEAAEVSERSLDGLELEQRRPGFSDGVSRRIFVAGMAALGATLLVPSLAFGEEAADLATKMYDGPSLGGWGDETSRLWVDSLGRRVEIPETINGVAPYGPYAQAMLESIDPSRVVNVSARGLHASALSSAQAQALSLSAYGIVSVDESALISEQPSLVIDMADSLTRLTTGVEEQTARADVPTVHISAAVEDLPQAYRTLGDLLGEQSAYDLADCTAQILLTFEQGRALVPQENRKRVYFGQGADGLDTRSAGTLLDDVFAMIGAENVAHDLSESQCFNGDAAMIEAWNPDFVILSIEGCDEGSESRELIRSIWRDTPLANGRDVRLVPSRPFGWLDRSPLTMQTLGALWLAHMIYPDIYDYDMATVMVDYFNAFFHETLSEAEAVAILDAAVDF